MDGFKRINRSPIAVDDEQRYGDGNNDGDRNPEYNEDGIPEGHGDTEVKTTSVNGQTKVKNPDDPNSVKIDSTWILPAETDITSGEKFGTLILNGKDTIKRAFSHSVKPSKKVRGKSYQNEKYKD